MDDIKIGDYVKLNNVFYDNRLPSYTEQFRGLTFKVIDFFNNDSIAEVVCVNEGIKLLETFFIDGLDHDLIYMRKLKLKKLLNVQEK